MWFADDDALRAIVSHDAPAVSIDHLRGWTRWIPQQAHAGSPANKGTYETLLRKSKPAGNASQHNGTDAFHRDEMLPNSLSPTRNNRLCWHRRWTGERIIRINGRIDPRDIGPDQEAFIPGETPDLRLEPSIIEKRPGWVARVLC